MRTSANALDGVGDDGLPAIKGGRSPGDGEADIGGGGGVHHVNGRPRHTKAAAWRITKFRR